MAKATKTIQQTLNAKPSTTTWFAETQKLYNTIVRFYFDVVQVHPGLLDLSNHAALIELEKLTHATKSNPRPVMPLFEIAPNVPAMFRRAAINAALGSARAFYTQLAQWRRRKEKAEAKGKRSLPRPPVPPRTWRKAPPLYAGMYKDRHASSILLKLWTGMSWAWVKCRLPGRALPAGWESGSPQLGCRQGCWRLHTPVEKTFASPGKLTEQLATNPDLTVCSVDLNLDSHLAVCIILAREGTVKATRFIGEGKRIHGLRKSLLGRIARNRGRTGIIAEGERDNMALWDNVHNLDEQTAQLISARIVQFAVQWGAAVIVFEHLGSLKPER